MQPVIPTLSFEQLRQAKEYASKSFKSLGIELSSSTAGNHVAHMFGYRDWNTARAITTKNSAAYAINENSHTASIENVQTTPQHYELQKVPRSGIMDYYRELTGGELSFEDQYLWDALSIRFVPTESTALFGVTGFGKTFLMMDWANALESDPNGMPFVYFLKRGHFMRSEDGKYRLYDASENVQARIASIENYAIGSRSAVFAIPEDMEYSIILGALRSAMKHGYHIFIDENPYLFEMLDEVVNAGYSNYTVAFQTVHSLFEHNMDEIYKYAFTNVLTGKQLDLGAGRYFQHMNIDIEEVKLSNLVRGRFYWAQTK